MPSDLEDLFQARAEAISTKDERRFLSTQVSEIEFAASSSYLSLDRMTAEVLCIHDESPLEKVVFVKETYWPTDKSSRSSFLIYFLTNTVDGWRIYKVR